MSNALRGKYGQISGVSLIENCGVRPMFGNWNVEFHSDREVADWEHSNVEN